jgi:hypothetical protein
MVVEPGTLLGVADGELDDGVAAVIGVQLDRGAGPVGYERVVAPGREELLLVVQVADAADDEPVAAEQGLGDLRDPAVGVGDLDPGRLGDGRDRATDGLGLPYGDREPDVVGAQPRDRLGSPES